MRTRIFIALLAVSALHGCATPVKQTNAAMKEYDKDTDYVVTKNANGFDISVDYNRYQFIPESDAVAMACKSALTSIAHEEAKKIGKTIKPINEQTIKISMGRNGVTGITSCSASVSAEWQK